MFRVRAVSLLLACALPMAAAAQEVIISAAASLTQAFKEVGAQFEAGHPGVTLRFNFAASGVLLKQMSQGAPADVFASADQATMNTAATQKLIDAATRRDFAANSLVLITPAQGGPAISDVKQLSGDAVKRIAVGKPATVPVGSYTKQALESAGLWESLQAKIVQADNVRQALDYVARGEVDAGFVYRTDAALMQDKVKIAQTVGGHEPVTYPVAVVAETRNRALATEFVNFLVTDAARQILGRYGFTQP